MLLTYLQPFRGGGFSDRGGFGGGARGGFNGGFNNGFDGPPRGGSSERGGGGYGGVDSNDRGGGGGFRGRYVDPTCASHLTHQSLYRGGGIGFQGGGGFNNYNAPADGALSYGNGNPGFPPKRDRDDGGFMNNSGGYGGSSPKRMRY